MVTVWEMMRSLNQKSGFLRYLYPQKFRYIQDELALSSRFIRYRPQKPPNILIYLEDNRHQTFQRHAERIADCLNPSRYTVYQLRHRQMEKDPWPENTCCLILLNTFRLEDADWNKLYAYWQNGGKLLFVSSQSLLQILTRVTEGLMPYHFLSHIFYRRNCKTAILTVLEALRTSGSQLSSATNEFDRRVRLKNSLNVVDVAANFIRNAFQSLMVKVESLSSGGQAVFTETDLTSEDPPWITPVLDSMRRLQLETSENRELPYTPGYLFVKELNQLEERFVHLGRVSGKIEVEFFPERSTSKIGPPQSDYIPVYLTPRNDAFSTEEYARHLNTERLGRALLYVPVVRTTMALFDGLMNYDDIIEHLVVVAGIQTKGQGRSGNKWISPVGSVAFSMGFKASEGSRIYHNPGFFQHILAVAVVDAIWQAAGNENVNIRLKWPNDIYYGRVCKLGGILVNCKVVNNCLCFVLGCGLNVSNPEPTVCVNQILPQTVMPFTCEQVIAIILSRLEFLIKQFERKGVEAILPLYYKYWLHKDQVVKLCETSQSVTIIGLDKNGYLEVKASSTNEVFSVQPDGNTFDMSHNLIRCKT